MQDAGTDQPALGQHLREIRRPWPGWCRRTLGEQRLGRALADRRRAWPRTSPSAAVPGRDAATRRSRISLHPIAPASRPDRTSGDLRRHLARAPPSAGTPPTASDGRHPDQPEASIAGSYISERHRHRRPRDEITAMAGPDALLKAERIDRPEGCPRDRGRREPELLLHTIGDIRAYASAKPARRRDASSRAAVSSAFVRGAGTPSRLAGGAPVKSPLNSPPRMYRRVTALAFPTVSSIAETGSPGATV